MGDEGDGVGEVEVFAYWGSRGVRHDGTMDCVSLARGAMNIDWELMMRCSRQHGENTRRQKGELLDYHSQNCEPRHILEALAAG